ncbi:MAG: MFS transporter [Candidatus Sungbacteria bacterium]|nr:MFS transporter [Candidatus Sungbacteria bacterium]
MNFLILALKKIKMPEVNQVVLTIVIAEFLLITGWGFLAPVFAVFVTQQIPGGSVAVVGFVITIYWVTKSILQLFVARFIDRNHGELDDFYFFLGGMFLNAIFISLYYFASEVWHVYLLHFLIAIADAMLVPPFYAIFTRHIDKGKEGFEWSLYSSFSLGAGSALGGAVGGLIATVAGFRIIFPLVGLFTFISAVILVFLKPFILPKVPVDEAPRILLDRKKI